MSTTYGALAPYYDLLMSDIDYDLWAELIDRLFAKQGIPKGSLILDAGCGTGQMTVRLAKKGYDMIGVDISPEMLSLARDFSEKERVNPLFICRDMSDTELYGTVKGAISCLDSVNYLTAPGQLERFFACMELYIEKDGLFIFDVNTKKKFEQVYADNAYILENEGVLCAWQNYYNPKTRLCTFDLSFFEEDADGRYIRSDERQTERCFPTATIKRLLARHSFEIVDIFGGLDMTKATEEHLRHYYVCKKV